MGRAGALIRLAFWPAATQPTSIGVRLGRVLHWSGMAAAITLLAAGSYMTMRTIPKYLESKEAVANWDRTFPDGSSPVMNAADVYPAGDLLHMATGSLPLPPPRIEPIDWWPFQRNLAAALALLALGRLLRWILAGE